MKISHKAANLLRTVLTTTGETTINPKGQEQPVERVFSGEERSQVRNFIKALIPITEELQKQEKELIKKHSDKIEKKRQELKGEKDVDTLLDRDPELIKSVEDTQEKLNTLYDKKIELSLTPKTESVLKKYFKEYSKDVGFPMSQDEMVEELEVLLK